MKPEARRETKPEARSQKPEEKAKPEVESQKPEEKSKSATSPSTRGSRKDLAPEASLILLRSFFWLLASGFWLVFSSGF
jgi:hypothetical protein